MHHAKHTYARPMGVQCIILNQTWSWLITMDAWSTLTISCFIKWYQTLINHNGSSTLIKHDHVKQLDIIISGYRVCDIVLIDLASSTMIKLDIKQNNLCGFTRDVVDRSVANKAPQVFMKFSTFWLLFHPKNPWESHWHLVDIFILKCWVFK